MACKNVYQVSTSHRVWTHDGRIIELEHRSCEELRSGNRELPVW